LRFFSKHILILLYRLIPNCIHLISNTHAYGHIHTIDLNRITLAILHGFIQNLILVLFIGFALFPHISLTTLAGINPNSLVTFFSSLNQFVYTFFYRLSLLVGILGNLSQFLATALIHRIDAIFGHILDSFLRIG
jgi:hypothetical protein